MNIDVFDFCDWLPPKLLCRVDGFKMSKMRLSEKRLAFWTKKTLDEKWSSTDVWFLIDEYIQIEQGLDGIVESLSMKRFEILLIIDCPSIHV